MDTNGDPVTSEDEARAIYEAARQLDPMGVGPNVDHEILPVAATPEAEQPDRLPASRSSDSLPPVEEEADTCSDGVWRVDQRRPPRLRDRFARLNRNLDAYRQDGTLR